MNKVSKSAFSVFAVILCLSFYFTPHLAVHNLQNAAEARDAAKISSYVDFPALKESLKANFNAMMAKEVANKATENGFEALGMAFAAALVNPLIDALVTPESLAMMLEGEKSLNKAFVNNDSDSKSSSTAHDEPETTLSYESFNSFVVNVTKKNSKDKPLGFVFSRDGLLGWKLTALRIPDMGETLAAKANTSQPEASTGEEPVAELNEPKWKYEETNDKFDGRKQFLSTAIESNQSTEAKLIFRKVEANLEAFIITGDGYICATDDTLNAAVIFDDEEPSYWHLNTSTSKDAIFFYDATILADKLKNSREMYIRVDDTCGSRTDLKVDAAGFGEAFLKFNNI